MPAEVDPDAPKDLRIQRLPVGYASEEATYVDEVEDVRPIGPWQLRIAQLEPTVWRDK